VIFKSHGTIATARESFTSSQTKLGNKPDQAGKLLHPSSAVGSTPGYI